MKVTTLALSTCVLLGSLPAEAATNNTGNAPVFIMVDLCSNGVGDQNGAFDVPRMAPDVLDVGLDVDADGSVDEWLSQQPATWLGPGNSDQVSYAGWRRFYFFQLDQYAGRMATIRIVDKSPDYYLAINTIRVNGADGTVVRNAIRNGFFEADNPLEGWRVLETNFESQSALVFDDRDGIYCSHGGRFLTTMPDPNGSVYTGTAVLESDPFLLSQPTSFIYANLSGGASEFVNLPGANGTDNRCGVYIDLGTDSTDPNGKFDFGTDIPVEGFWGGGGGVNDFGVIVVNTSGLEGRRAQVVAFDDSTLFHVALDAVRMNWDWEESIIQNGGFDQGLPKSLKEPPHGALGLPGPKRCWFKAW